MEIINHFKSQADQSMKYLQQEGIITEEDRGLVLDSQQQREQQLRQPSINGSTKHSQSSSQVNEASNPYFVSHTASSLLPPLQKCIICRSKSKYRCPQCLVSYCSLQHYKSHNLFCSQQFYKKQVLNEMKSIKASKEQKQQMKEVLKQHNEEKQKDIRVGNISEERLVELLEMIEESEKNGVEINEKALKLTEDEVAKLQQYIQTMQIDDQSINAENKHQSPQNTGTNLQSTLHLATEPYWLTPDGLDYYFMQQLQIEQFSSSANMQIVIKREILAKRYRQEIKELASIFTKGKVSPYVKDDVLQFLTIYVLMVLGWGGEFNNKEEIFEVFDSLYADNLAQDLATKGLSQFQAGQYTFSKIQQNISTLKCPQTQKLLTTWFETQTIQSCKLIVKNKFLLVETFLKLLELFQSIEKDLITVDSDKNTIDSLNNPQMKQLKVNNKSNKKKLIKLTKYIKKIQFLLAYIKDEMSHKIIKIVQQQEHPQLSTLQPKQSYSQNDLFRRLYRSLSREENKLLQRKKQIQMFNQMNQEIKNIQKQGILIRQS